jgi:hypothetical protein
MFITPFMGLTAWDLGDDPYDHTQLAANFDALDGHDHTSGKGRQIPKDGIANSAIDGTKLAANAVNPLVHIPANSIPDTRLADNSVGRRHLQDSAVGSAELENGSVTAAKLDPTILPVGITAMWYRGDAAVLPPTNWEVMDGRSWSTIPNALGAGGTQLNTGVIPDMTNKFPLGSALAGTGTGPDLPPGIGATAGQHERNLSHTHVAAAHSHSVDAHAHGIGIDGGHNHKFVANTPGGASLRDIYSRDVGVPRAEGSRQALYVQEHNLSSFAGSDVVLPMETVGGHSHGGSTGASGTGTNAATVTINNGLTADLDFRPAHVGLLFIMKVR